MRKPLVAASLLIVMLLLFPLGTKGQETSPTDAAPADTEVSVFNHFVVQGGAITWFVLIPMSIAMVAMSISQFLLIRRTRFCPPYLRDELTELVDKKQYQEAVELTEDEPSMLGHLVYAGLAAKSSEESMLHAIQETMEERTAILFRKIEYLNVLGNVAPMVGLFGTVYGMIRAFHSLVETGGVPDPGKLALGISVALVTTFWGLLVAIPALSVYAISRNRLDALAPECSLVAEEILRPVHLFDSAQDTVELIPEVMPPR